MATCAVCGNEYDKAFTVTTAEGRSYDFDSMECAAHMVAPTCGHCGCRILGHGVEAEGGRIFCCPTCARSAGFPDVRA